MRKMFYISFFILLCASILQAQTPQYYNYQGVGSQNTFPFGQTNGKAVNWLFLPGAFNQPTPCPTGQQITRAYVYFGTGGSRTYTNLHILMAQDTITTLTQGQFYPGPWDTVFFSASATLTASSNSWEYIPLDTPYPYDPTKSLLVFVGQCAGPGSGMYVYQNTLATYKRVWSVGGCPFTPYPTSDGRTVNSGIDVEPVPVPPDLIYYKFEDNPSANMTLNCGLPGVGNNPAALTGTTALTSGGQFDSCIVGDGVTNGGVVTGWNTNLGAGSWTISMWVLIPTTTSGSAFYIFGDPGSSSFRCFHNGVAGVNNLVLRGTGISDVNVTGIGPSPTVVTFVYDSVAHNIKAYKNGVLANTVSNTLNLPTGSGFKVGAYSSSRTFVGKLDEFRVFRRALDTSEIAAMWNHELPCGLITGIANQHNSTPLTYMLSQNYPNPFNPATKISYALPKAGNVKLVIYDVLGREIATLVNESKKAGHYTVDFNASNLASGVYIYRIEAGTYRDAKKMMLIK